MNKIKILIADDIEETRDVIKKFLNIEEERFEIVGVASNGEEVLDLIPKCEPQIVLMDINMPVLNGLEATKIISDKYPSVIVIIMSVQGETEYLKKAMLHGAKEYIVKPFDYDSLVNTIDNTYEINKDKVIITKSKDVIKRNADIFSFFSSKGGVGKSILALNSAVVLSKNYKKKTLLIDMDLQFGDISMLVNNYNNKTIIDIIDDGQFNSYDNIKQYLYEYNNNFDILFAPRNPESAEYISKESVENIIEILKSYYDIIVVDTGVNFNDETLHILDISKVIFLISTMEIVALKNTKLSQGVMNSLGYDEKKVKLIINSYSSRQGIKIDEIEEVFKDKVFGKIPEDKKTVSNSVNEGHPFTDSRKYNRAKISKAIETLWKGIIA